MNQDKWEKELDRLIKRGNFVYGYGVDQIVDWDEIKDFIRSLLTSQKERMVDKAIKAKLAIQSINKTGIRSVDISLKEASNALDDIIKKLEAQSIINDTE